MKGRKLGTGDFVTYLIRHAGASLRARELRQILFFFFSERPVDIGINIAVLTISDIEEENMVSQAPFAWFTNVCVRAVTYLIVSVAHL